MDHKGGGGGGGYLYKKVHRETALLYVNIYKLGAPLCNFTTRIVLDNLQETMLFTSGGIAKLPDEILEYILKIALHFDIKDRQAPNLYNPEYGLLL